jgi:hypothetical protein
MERESFELLSLGDRTVERIAGMAPCPRWM